MRKILLLGVACLFFSTLIFGQHIEHKMVVDFTKEDTASFSTVVRQAKNIMVLSGNVKLEIVCHGPGLDVIMKEKTTVRKEIEELQEKYSVVFAACEATMKRRSIDKSQLLSQVIFVPLATLEFSSKQHEGWSYFKAGYNP